jgi:rod shape-determining protein MreB
MLATRVGIEVIVAEDPVSCVAVGTGIALNIMDRFADIAGL